MKAVIYETFVFSRFAGLLLIAGSASLFASSPAPEVLANGELLSGAWADTPVPVARFSGIPFARPPLGAMRWRAPQPHLPREGKQAARGFAAACMQDNGNVDWYAGLAQAFGHGAEVVERPVEISEDCLYLNVWSPQLSAGARLPVMVFVHGGSNRGGWSYEPNYIGQNLAARGVVVVTITYRLGPFGFFSHRVLNNGEGEPVANFALLDIRAAFQWVHQHISAFGGDPENITGFGESSGAFNLADLLLADLDSGNGKQSLFNRLILQSIGGPSRTRRTLVEEQEIGDELAGSLGLAGDVTDRQLRDVPAEDILKAAGQLPSGHYFSAVIDGVTVPRHPMTALGRVQATGVELITGTNADEWYMYISRETSREDLETWISENAPEHQAALLEFTADEKDARKALDRLRTARQMMCPSRYLAQTINNAGGQAWVYFFDRQRPGAGGQQLGVYHGAELPYVFDRHDFWLPTTETDRMLSKAMIHYWVEFARNGNPNGSSQASWPLYTDQQPELLLLSDRIGSFPDTSTELCEMLAPGSRQPEAEK